MHEQYTDLVIPTLAQHLGVRVKEIAPAHELQRDWGLTPLSLVTVLVDLERVLAIELPSHELVSVKTVADLMAKLRQWLHASKPDSNMLVRRRARRTRHALRERRIRRELHFLRWLEQNEKSRARPRARAAARRPR